MSAVTKLIEPMDFAPWCVYCDKSFADGRRYGIHIRMSHEYPQMRSLCRAFGWAWGMNMAYAKYLYWVTHDFPILRAKVDRQKAVIKDLYDKLRALEEICQQKTTSKKTSSDSPQALR